MSKPLRKIGYLLVAVMMMLQPHFVQAERQSWDQLFQKDIQNWMDNIISNDRQFSEWRYARTKVQTLGANQHQWLVSVTKSGKQVGYLVVGEAMPAKQGKQTPSFVLLEYGVGEYVLFDDTFAPKQVAAEPVYDGFASYWRVAQNSTNRLIDAKTGERYPLETQPEPAVMETIDSGQLATDGKPLTKTRTLLASAMDPFDQIKWLQNLNNSQAKKPDSWDRLLQEAESRFVILNVSLFKDEVMAPFTVGSIHLWNDQAAYVGVWDEGLRFVPYAYAAKVGTFLYNE